MGAPGGRRFDSSNPGRCPEPLRRPGRHRDGNDVAARSRLSGAPTMAIRPQPSALMFDTTPQLDCAGRVLVLDRARVLGIVNVTPDSFSDGGLHSTVESAVVHGLRLAEEGAEALGVGGGWTRAGAQDVLWEQERRRVIPVLAQLSTLLTLPISIDTSKPEVMRAAVDAGVGMITDVSALRREGALDMAAARGVPV